MTYRSIISDLMTHPSCCNQFTITNLFHDEQHQSCTTSQMAPSHGLNIYSLCSYNTLILFTQILSVRKAILSTQQQADKKLTQGCNKGKGEGKDHRIWKAKETAEGKRGQSSTQGHNEKLQKEVEKLRKEKGSNGFACSHRSCHDMCYMSTYHTPYLLQWQK